MKQCTGFGSAGKSSIAHQIVEQKFYETLEPTLEEKFQTSLQIDKTKQSFTILDTAGYDSYNVLLDGWVDQCEGFLLCYDITKKESLNEIERIFQKIVNNKTTDIELEVDLPFFPMVIIGCKCDLEEKRQVSKEEGYEFSRKLIFRNNSPKEFPKMPFFLEVSSKDNLNIHESFKSLFNQMYYRQDWIDKISKKKPFRSCQSYQKETEDALDKLDKFKK